MKSPFGRLNRLAILILGLASTSIDAGEIEIRRVFGPEIATGPYKHPACMTELYNGDLYLVYYGGQGEYATDTAVYGSRCQKGETRWSTPEPIAHDPLRSVGNAVIWQAPDGMVWLFYVVRDGATWSSSRIQFKVSRDGARAGRTLRCSRSGRARWSGTARSSSRMATISCPPTGRREAIPNASARKVRRCSIASTRRIPPGPKAARSARPAGISNRPSWRSERAG